MTNNNKGIATIAVVLIIVGVIVVVGGVVGGIVGYNAYQEKKQQEAEQDAAKNLEEARNNAINTYNNRVNQVMTSLNVEKDGIASLDNNEDITAMSNAVNELNNIINEINNDTLLTQEHKVTLSGIVSGHIDSINNRINAVNEARAEAERLAKIKSESELKSIAAGYGNVGIWGYADYDGNGSKEAFAVIGNPMPSQGRDVRINKVVFISSNGEAFEVINDIDRAAYYSESGCVKNYGGKEVFWFDYGAYGSGWQTVLLGVENEKPYELGDSRKSSR